VASFCEWRLAQLRAAGPINPTESLKTARKALNMSAACSTALWADTSHVLCHSEPMLISWVGCRLLAVQRGLPTHSFSAGANQLIKVMVKESVAYTRAARQRYVQAARLAGSVPSGWWSNTDAGLCSVEEAPTKDSLTAQFFTPSEISQLLVRCRALGSRLGLQTAAMVMMGIYGGLR
jgi:hypothetical protein